MWAGITGLNVNIKKNVKSDTEIWKYYVQLYSDAVILTAVMWWVFLNVSSEVVKEHSKEVRYSDKFNGG